MPMYRERPPLADSHELDQGDILKGLVQPKPASKKSLVPVRDKTKIDWPPKPEHLKKPDEELRLVCRLEFPESLIVLSNSCDNAGEYPLILAPIRPFEFSDGVEGDPDRWEDVSEAATGTASPKLFYLPGDVRFGLQRSEARLPNLFTLEHSIVQRCIVDRGTSRVCGLTPAAQRHLQWALNLLFSRDPREDDEWPSDEDFRLKLAWLDSQIAQGSARQEAYRAERDRIRARLGL